MGTIIVNNLGKAYKQYPTKWSRVADWIWPRRNPRHSLKWVLQDINFTITPGEAVGIVGINGAGKSTLLKLITGTSQPTTGSVIIRGRVAAMLELGMGFHPDFTGRQNAVMAGQLLGYTLEDLAGLMPAIEEFAEIGDYIDQPVRVYSSGMQMRLAFSVATAVRPDVLIVDEALSVGDAYFQHKSFDRIREYRALGTTLLIVSHDKGAIQAICDRAIVLNAGRVALEGNPEAAMDFYNAMLAEKENHTVRQLDAGDGKVQTISGSGEATVEQATLRDTNHDRVEIVNVGQNVVLDVTVRMNTDIPALVLGYMIKDRLGQPVFGTNTHHLKEGLESLRSGSQVNFLFRFAANLGEGTYSIAIALHTDETHIAKNYEWRDMAIIFNVVNFDKLKFVGSAWLPPVLECDV